MVALGSGSCKRPGELGGDDYVQFKHYTEVANEVYINQKKLDVLAGDLKKNSYQNLCIKAIMGVIGVCSILGAIANQIQKIKNKAKNLWQVRRNEPEALPMYQSKIL